MDTINENHFYLDKVWVQCEIGSCLKWRLLSSDDAAQVDHSEPWYCYMNTDPWFNNCSVSEEYFPEESEFNKNGFKYVYSELPIGSLVLVKMRNWPRWPGILCPDPLNGQYVTYDLDGYVKSNHVEFLGDPHSRGWVAVKYISRYPSSIKPEQCKRKKKWYTSALEEANKLLMFSAPQRLEMCQLSENGAGVLEDKTEASNDTVVSKRRIKAQKKQVVKKNRSGIGQKRKKSMLRCSLETMVSDDFLSKENLVVSETEVILKDLEQILRRVADPLKTACGLYGNGEGKDTGEKVTKCSTESTEGSPMENYTQEDCIIIDGLAFRAGECIENISNTFKEIDSLMAEFQDSL
ncbi:zinc finger CW-type PWWP domain protein 2 [Trachemys scripta elegans]|uniref:zinc finger CW-type PWWP domain protein 2 n=1 Tax=Trachemys scripta elegans TaxID=31138 RepID=UPI00155427AD|nr:zinc finger CW-type PWWP domain protein 2 [Trachemys scripta elegans]